MHIIWANITSYICITYQNPLCKWTESFNILFASLCLTFDFAFHVKQQKSILANEYWFQTSTKLNKKSRCLLTRQHIKSSIHTILKNWFLIKALEDCFTFILIYFYFYFSFTLILRWMHICLCLLLAFKLCKIHYYIALAYKINIFYNLEHHFDMEMKKSIINNRLCFTKGCCRI